MMSPVPDKVMEALLKIYMLSPEIGEFNFAEIVPPLKLVLSSS